MTDFLTKSLELLGQPAALYEHPSMEYIACNDGDAGRLLTELLDATSAVGNIEKYGYYAKELPRAVLFATLMRTKPDLTRPDLVIATLHPHTSRENAYMAHNRMVMMLNLNESADTAMRNMEHAIFAMQTSLSVVRDMVRDVNATAAEFNRLDAENLRPRY